MAIDKARINSIASRSTRAELQNMVNDMAAKVDKAIDIVVEYGGIDGAHHKDWVLDQVVRALADKEYDRIVSEACDGEDGPNTYSWDCGIAP